MAGGSGCVDMELSLRLPDRVCVACDSRGYRLSTPIVLPFLVAFACLQVDYFGVPWVCK